MSDLAVHRITVPGDGSKIHHSQVLHAVALIERGLGVRAWTKYQGENGWVIEFNAPADVDLSYLRQHLGPDFLSES